MSRARLNLFVEPDHARRLAALAAREGVSKSAIVATALSAWLSPQTRDRREVAMARRLDQLSRQFGRIERDQAVLVETVALFVRYFLTVSTPVPEAHQAAAKAQGRVRFAQFVEQLARHLRRGRSLVQDAMETSEPEMLTGDDTVSTEPAERAS